MKLGADPALVNTAIAVAGDPNRNAHGLGPGTPLDHAGATSPLTGFLD
jgi:thiazole synthase ThiGH ThiG subunit